MQLNKEAIRSLNYGEFQNFPEIFNSTAVIDSREVETSMIFVALKGEKTDGHNFVLSLKDKKPAFCVVEKNWFERNKTAAADMSLWIVDNSEKALQLLAIKVREITKIPVFALTGTNGKTSTRSMIVAVLNKKYNALSTKGNLNNHLGLPLSILRMEEKHNIAVLEMGTNHFGEIDFLCKIAKPNFGLITNIGRGHTEFLKSPAGVAKAKEELFLSIPQAGKIFINADDRYIPKMNFKAKDIIRYGFEAPDLNYRGEITNIDTFGRATISINNEIEIKVPVPGVYQAFNALAAATVGHHFGVTYAQIKEALENFQGVSNRLGIKNYRCTIIDDTYNANPESTLGAIQTLAGIKTAGKKYFILGDMLELGDKKEIYHGEMGKAVAATDIDYFFTQGKLTHHAHAAALKSGHPKALHFDTKKEIIDQLKKQLKPQDIVLLKGSRGSKMEKIIEGIKE